MPATLRFPDSVKPQINSFLGGFEDPGVQFAVTLELRRALDKLSAAPLLGTSPPGPFEGRPIHRFHLSADGRRRLAQVVYRHNPGDNTLDILGFSVVDAGPA
jgi:hypothetical protein